MSGNRTLFRLSRVQKTGNDFVLFPLNPVSSADLFGIQGANAYARFSPGKYTLRKGDPVSFRCLDRDNFSTEEIANPRGAFLSEHSRAKQPLSLAKPTRKRKELSPA